MRVSVRMLAKVTCWTTVESGLDSYWGRGDFLFIRVYTHTYMDLAASMGIKRPGCEAHFTAEFKNAWSCAYISPYIYVACYLIKHGGRELNFYFSLHFVHNECICQVADPTCKVFEKLIVAHLVRNSHFVELRLSCSQEPTSGLYLAPN